MMSRFPAVAFAYLVLTIVFVATSALRVPYRDSPRFPSVSLVREPSQNLGGLVKDGLWRLDHAKLRSSMDRSSSVRLVRETGNSIRLLAGQRVEWIIWGSRTPLMLFGTVELWVSRGLTPQARNELEHKTEIIAGYARRLAAEGWVLVVLPVPTKLGIHRELCLWPIEEQSLVSRDLVTKDRSDETYAYFVEGLRNRGVTTVDLQDTYRNVLRQKPDILLYVPGDSHWSGEGIRIAAEATASAIASVTELHARAPRSPTFHVFDYVGDMVKAFDPLPIRAVGVTVEHPSLPRPGRWSRGDGLTPE